MVKVVKYGGMTDNHSSDKDNTNLGLKKLYSNISVHNSCSVWAPCAGTSTDTKYQLTDSSCQGGFCQVFWNFPVHIEPVKVK